MRARLDAELVRRGDASSRARAVELIESGRVRVDGGIARRPGTDLTGRMITVDPADDSEPTYVSRGGHKLAGALAQLTDLSVRDRRCLDAGASTGGFTEVLLARGAAEVVALDVGHDQLAEPLRHDSRVTVHEGVNVRAVTSHDIGGPVHLVTADLSFISLTLVLPALRDCTTMTGDLLVLVKPQFEVGRARLGRGGVVRDADARVDALMTVLSRAGQLGMTTQAVTRSVLPGPAGNVEFFAWLTRSDEPVAGVGPDCTELLHLATDAQAAPLRL